MLSPGMEATMENTKNGEDSGDASERPVSGYTRRQLVDRMGKAAAIPVLVALSMSWTDIAAATI